VARGVFLVEIGSAPSLGIVRKAWARRLRAGCGAAVAEDVTGGTCEVTGLGWNSCQIG
jgi:hypothetical protein